MEIGFPLVGGEKGFKGSIIRAKVFESNSKVKSSSKDLKKHLGKEKKFFFRCQKTPLKFGLNFWGVTDLPPLKEYRPRD